MQAGDGRVEGRGVPGERLATASAVNAAFRQVGAVLGTAILVAIVGDPASLADSLSVADTAYLFAVFAALASGAVTLGLRPLAMDEPAARSAFAPVRWRFSNRQ